MSSRLCLCVCVAPTHGVPREELESCVRSFSSKAEYELEWYDCRLAPQRGGSSSDKEAAEEEEEDAPPGSILMTCSVVQAAWSSSGSGTTTALPLIN